MFRKNVQKIFCISFFVMLLVPMFLTNFKSGKISTSEKRVLASFPSLHLDDGSINQNYVSDFDLWLNDNVGLREQMVLLNAKISYYIFHTLSNNSDMYYLGPKNELVFATADMIEDYQHLNLYDEAYLQDMSQSLQCIADYAQNSGAEFYYYQCWDKHSIYPEQFPRSVIQYGNLSKTDGIVRAIEEYSDVQVISPKRELIEAKAYYDTYGEWADPTHWTNRGAYVGYLKFMETLNSKRSASEQFKVLQENEYDLSVGDYGARIFGGISEPDILENFMILDPKAELRNDLLTLYADDNRHLFYVNDSIDNDETLLIIGDSYWGMFLVDDLAESFANTILIWGDYIDYSDQIIDAYHPDIVVVEAAERVDRTFGMIRCRQLMNGEEPTPVE